MTDVDQHNSPTCSGCNYAAEVRQPGAKVTPGNQVCFDIVPKMNETVIATLVPQIFRAQITMLGDGFTPLDTRDVFFLVPPRIPDPNE